MDSCSPLSVTKVRDHPISAVRDCLFSILVATLHIWRKSSPSVIRKRTIPRWLETHLACCEMLNNSLKISISFRWSMKCCMLRDLSISVFSGHMPNVVMYRYTRISIWKIAWCCRCLPYRIVTWMIIDVFMHYDRKPPYTRIQPLSQNRARPVWQSVLLS